MQKIVEEFVDSYLTEAGIVNPWFTRRLKEQPEAVQAEVRKELRRRGLLNDWLTDEDWDWLAKRILDNLDKAPRQNLVQLCNGILSQRNPPPAKRVTARNIQPLLGRLQRMVADYQDLRARREQLERPPDEVLAGISNEALLGHIGRMLDELGTR